MVDGTDVPNFIQLIESENNLFNKKVYIYATEEEDIGFYEMQIKTTLEDEKFQEGLQPHIAYFNVTVQ